MPGYKRKQPGGDGPLAPKKRRTDIPKITATDKAFQSLAKKMSMVQAESITPEVFVELCGYLCVILRWGFCIQESELDAFILLYPHFAQLGLRNLEEEPTTESRLKTSYHTWFADHPADLKGRRTMTEKTLREIWRENPYVFLRVEATLESAIWVQAVATHDQKQAQPDDGKQASN